MPIVMSIGLTVVLIVPGILVGGLVRIAYLFMVGHLLHGGALDWITNGWAGAISLELFPNALHGFVGGAVALYLSSRVIKSVRFEIASYAVSSLLVVFAILGVMAGWFQRGLELGMLGVIAQTAGCIAGIFAVAPSVDSEAGRIGPRSQGESNGRG